MEDNNSNSTISPPFLGTCPMIMQQRKKGRKDKDLLLLIIDLRTTFPVMFSLEFSHPRRKISLPNLLHIHITLAPVLSTFLVGNNKNRSMYVLDFSINVCQLKSWFGYIIITDVSIIIRTHLWMTRWRVSSYLSYCWLIAISYECYITMWLKHL